MVRRLTTVVVDALEGEIGGEAGWVSRAKVILGQSWNAQLNFVLGSYLYYVVIVDQLLRDKLGVE